MNNMVIFIIGILFYAMVVPIFNALANYVISIFDVKKGKNEVKLHLMEYELSKIGSSQEKTPCVGFDTNIYPSEDELLEE